MNLRISGGVLVTMAGGDGAPAAGDLWITGGRIVGVGGAPPSGFDSSAFTTIAAHGCFVVPGFVQGHLHLVQTLHRGEAEEMALLDWLRRVVWPLEAAHDEATLRAAARAGIAECIQSGVTSLFDMGTTHGHQYILEELVHSGIRAWSGKAMMDMDPGGATPPRLLESTAASLDESETLANRYDGSGGGRIRYCYAPRFALSASAELHREAARRAQLYDRRVHTHASEQRAEVEAVRARFGASCVKYLQSAGLAEGRFTIAHAVHLEEGEVELLRDARAGVAHCPISNLKLGSGICDVPRLRRAGVPVALGSDGAACNNRLDIFREMSAAALLARRGGDLRALPAKAILQMATIEGARAVGLDGTIGSLEVGKRADITIIDPRFPATSPGRDPYVTIVHAASPENVRDVFCDGEPLKLQFKPVRFDPNEVAAKANEAATALRARAGM